MATRREGSRLLLGMACGKGQRVERGGRLGTLAPVPRERVIELINNPVREDFETPREISSPREEVTPPNGVHRPGRERDGEKDEGWGGRRTKAKREEEMCGQKGNLSGANQTEGLPEPERARNSWQNTT
ncbi:hypothetical protein K0M31_017116 [Melipona bicolor]|uniref:Uncharacterized protein n=1 Tax=Melipona bicolor TaxID=60889 RepID=A0AA40FDF2_9HYME|nr:hypothetical protein K0M31_017116 [Melipona bicolor]